MSFTEPVFTILTWCSAAVLLGTALLFRFAAAQTSSSRQTLLVFVAAAISMIALVLSNGVPLSAVFLLCLVCAALNSWSQENVLTESQGALFYSGLAYLLVLNWFVCSEGWVGGATVLGVYVTGYALFWLMGRKVA